MAIDGGQSALDARHYIDPSNGSIRGYSGGIREPSNAELVAIEEKLYPNGPHHPNYEKVKAQVAAQPKTKLPPAIIDATRTVRDPSDGSTYEVEIPEAKKPHWRDKMKGQEPQKHEGPNYSFERNIMSHIRGVR